MSIVLDGDNLATKGVINSATAKTATGTAVDFTGIPAGIKRITVMFNGVSTNGTSIVQVQVGNGAAVTSGYAGAYALTVNAASPTVAAISTGIGTYYVSAADVRNGFITFVNVTGNVWIANGMLNNNGANVVTTSGIIGLSSTLDRIRITTVNGTDTFDAGSINILYE